LLETCTARLDQSEKREAQLHLRNLVDPFHLAKRKPSHVPRIYDVESRRVSSQKRDPLHLRTRRASVCFVVVVIKGRTTSCVLSFFLRSLFFDVFVLKAAFTNPRSLFDLFALCAERLEPFWVAFVKFKSKDADELIKRKR
jgi:hypothetical protein